jgi:hypothetical protein
VWRRRREAASAAALYSVYSGLYSEAVVSSVTSAVALAEVGQFREAVEYVQRAAEALYEAARDAFEKVKVSVQRLVELFVEAVARVLAWIDEHKAYLFLMAAVAAGVVALSAALNLWGLVELEKLAYAASAAPFVAGLADTGGRAAERFRAVAERWRVDDNEKKQKIEEIINEVVNAPQKRERPFSKLTSLKNLPKPLAELRKALKRALDKAKIDEVEKDAAVVAVLVLYKTLVKNAEAYGEWAGWYKWARGLVEKQEFTVSAGDIKRLRGAHRRLEEAAEEVRRELNAVLTLYALHSHDWYEKLRPHLEVDLGMAEELAEARRSELSKYSDANMGTKAYAALLSIARGGMYGHAAMLLMREGAIADVALLTPRSAYDKAKRVAKRRGEAVDPSRSPKGAVDWEERAVSVLLQFLIGYGETDLKFRRVEKKGKKDGEKRRVERGFQVFRTFGDVEAFVGELWIGDAAYSTLSKEELRRFVEEAKRTTPDLSGIKKIWQTLEWFATDVSLDKGQIEAGTVHTWQAAWYVALFGEPESISGTANVTGEGRRPNVNMRWRRERLDHIIAAEREVLKPLLRPISKQGGGSIEAEGPAVQSWRELVDAIDWSRVLEKVEELAGSLKHWIGSEGMSYAEREGLVRRMLGELTLLAHFAEARRGKNDGDWREERTKRLARAVEALSGGRIVGDDANELAKLIIRYAERREERTKGRIKNLAEKVGVSKEEVWGIVEFVLSDMYCLARDCARDEVVRKFVAPALELVMLDKALRGELDREEALLYFGEMYATAIAGDGSVGPDKVDLVVGGELGGGAALLRLATLHLLKELLSEELKFDVRVYLKRGVYDIAAYGENAARFKRIFAVSAPSAGGEYLSPKFDEFVEEARVEVRLDENSIKRTKKGRVAADLIISEAGVAVKYYIYLGKKTLQLDFVSADRSRAELAARLLRHAGVNPLMYRRGDGGDEWRVYATIYRLAAGHEELRKALAEIVKKAVEKGLVNTNTAERWLEKLKGGVTLMEGWPRYSIVLKENGALMIRFGSTNPDSIQREVQRLKEMGLKEIIHFTVTTPDEGGGVGYVSILKEGLAYAAWLSVRGKDKQQRKLAAKFVKLILRRAEEVDKKVKGVYEKVKEIIEEGMSRGSLELNFEKSVEVNGKTYVVKVIGGEAVEEDRGGRKLLRIKIKAEVGYVKDGQIVDRVEREYTITYGRYGETNAVVGFAYARADPDGREADAERLAAVIKALTGEEPNVRRKNGKKIVIECYRRHLEGFMRYAELVETIMSWLEETRR